MFKLYLPSACVVSFVLWTICTGLVANFEYTFTSTSFYLSILPPISSKEPWGDERGDVLESELCSMANLLLLFFSYFSGLLMLILLAFGSFDTFFKCKRLIFLISFSSTPVSLIDSMMGSSKSETIIFVWLAAIPLPPLAESDLFNALES